MARLTAMDAPGEDGTVITQSPSAVAAFLGLGVLHIIVGVLVGALLMRFERRRGVFAGRRRPRAVLAFTVGVCAGGVSTPLWVWALDRPAGAWVLAACGVAAILLLVSVLFPAPLSAPVLVGVGLQAGVVGAALSPRLLAALRPDEEGVINLVVALLTFHGVAIGAWALLIASIRFLFWHARSPQRRLGAPMVTVTTQAE